MGVNMTIEESIHIFYHILACLLTNDSIDLTKHLSEGDTSNTWKTAYTCFMVFQEYLSIVDEGKHDLVNLPSVDQELWCDGRT